MRQGHGYSHPSGDGGMMRGAIGLVQRWGSHTPSNSPDREMPQGHDGRGDRQGLSPP